MTVDDLYATPLEGFVAARDQLAKELAASGDDEEATRVKGLRKPTITAWTLNRIAREQPDLIAALVDSHQRLRSADSASAMRTASEARMAAIQQIVEAPEGATEAVRKKVRTTLLAVATDPPAQEALVAGRLQTELEPSGLGGFDLGTEFVATAPAPATKSESAGGKAPEKPESAKTVKARERVERLRQEADEAVAEARTLRTEADRAERLAATAEGRAAKKRAAAETARQNLESA